MANVKPLFGLKADSSRSEPTVEQNKSDALRRKQLARRQADATQNEKPLDQATNRANVPVPAGDNSPTRRFIEQRLTVVNAGSVSFVKETALSSQFVVPPLPSNMQPRSFGSLIGFALCVILPMFIASIYFGFIAANQYVAEFRFTVKDATSNASPAGGGLLALAGKVGGDSSDNYLVADFLTSREAIEKLRQKFDVVGLYSKPEADWWTRFNSSQPMERFVSYWQSMVTAHFDPVTGLTIATVRAFSPADALLIARSLVTLSEDLINEIANRAQRDSVRFADTEVERAQNRLKGVQARMTEYRNRAGVINPTASVVASNSTLVQTLQGNLAQLQTQLETLKRQNLDPNAPAIVTLNNQIRSVKERLEITEAAVGKSRDGTPLSTVMGDYEQLDLERQFAQAMVTSSMQALDQARANAAAQHLYITPYVRPSLPSSAAYPRPFLETVKVGAIAFFVWLIGLLVTRSIRERFV